MNKRPLVTDWKSVATPGPGQKPVTQVVMAGIAPPAQLSPELVKAIQDQVKAATKPSESPLILIDAQQDQAKTATRPNEDRIIVDVQPDFTPTSSLGVSK